MILGNIFNLGSLPQLLTGPIWERAFAELRALSTKTPDGINCIDGNKFLVNVHGYSTLPVSDCRFEGHHHTIDVQYTIDGSELIHWAPKWELEADGDYQADRDFQFFRDPKSSVYTQLKMTAGNFAIFFPDDGHRPKIRCGAHSVVQKAVVKIDTSLLAN